MIYQHKAVQLALASEMHLPTVQGAHSPPGLRLTFGGHDAQGIFCRWSRTASNSQDELETSHINLRNLQLNSK